MRIYSLSLLLLGSLGFAGAAAAQSAEDQARQIITVVSMGRAVAAPDLAIVSLSTRSSAPLATDALDQNRKKVQDIKARLAALGYKDGRVRFSGDRFSPAGGQGVYYPGGQRPTGFDVYNNIQVYLEAADLKDVNQFNAKVGALLDEVSKLGASAGLIPISSYSMGGASLVAFTVRDPGPFEQQAYSQALERARPVAEDIARRMKVQITGIRSVMSSTFGRSAQGLAIRDSDDIPFEYISSSIDEVPVRVRLTVQYAYK